MNGPAYDKHDSPKVGDIAEHKFRDLDGRKVVKVQGSSVWLQIGDLEAGPLPAENYMFLRRKEQA